MAPVSAVPAADYIVVGAGAAGCIVAARLSEDPRIRVLLIEAGGSDRNPMITMPGALPFVYQRKQIQWGYRSGPEPELGGRTIDEKMGKVVGGGTSINAMIYNRGNPMDFDGWAADGLADWRYADCLPYFRKMETFADGADDWRGGDGPMRISRARADHVLYDTFLRAGEQAGHEVTPDHNGFRQEGLHVAQSFIHGGVRWSAARAYLRPALKRDNLRLLTGAIVQRVVFDHGAAIGVEVSGRNGSEVYVCEREVILCAGAVKTPQLLMLSGVGDPDALRRHGIAIVAEAREVGLNLQNHPGVDLQFATRREDSLVSELGPFGRLKLGVDWIARRQGLGTTNFFETGAFLRTRDTVAFPNTQYEFLPLRREVRRGKVVPVPGFQYWMDLSRPDSRGAVTLNSADPTQQPSIVFNHLAARQDIRDLIHGIRMARTMSQQAAWQRFQATEITPGSNVESDADLESFLRAKVGTSYHPSGTCRMGADAEAVVDGEGRAVAVARVRIVDASIMPRVVTANLNAAVMMMAEKVSDRILGKPALSPSKAAYYRSPGDVRP
ncbi:MAG TPA: choline dehydrogenase [Candidatus Limnocylindrales bacterium]|nr:choline dehydrogenase [Candidatus Limnocylindrales bacterium]